VSAFTRLYAPCRETDRNWHNEVYIAFGGEVWFWAAIQLAARIDENHQLWPFRCAVGRSSSKLWWDDHRLYPRLIREAPKQALKLSRLELMAHPILRIARLKYSDESIEQTQVLRFLNAQCIREGFESEEDCFTSDLTLGQWVRDARRWATHMLQAELEVGRELFHEAGESAVERTRMFYYHCFGSGPGHLDSLDATAALMKWTKQRRGFPYSKYRAQAWEFIVEIVDAALWLGWVF